MRSRPGHRDRANPASRGKSLPSGTSSPRCQVGTFFIRYQLCQFRFLQPTAHLNASPGSGKQSSTHFVPLHILQISDSELRIWTRQEKLSGPTPQRTARKPPRQDKLSDGKIFRSYLMCLKKIDTKIGNFDKTCTKSSESRRRELYVISSLMARSPRRCVDSERTKMC